MKPSARANRIGLFLAHPWLGPVVLIAVCLPLTLWRSHLETNFWIDETYSIMLTTYPVPKLVAFTASDAHPPGYYLALKAWNKMGRLMGFEPGVLWARSVNIGFWLLLVVVVWVAGRRLAGPHHGPLIAWAVAGNAYAALVARDMRSYGITTVALTVCFLALVFLAGADDKDGPTERRRIPVLWAVYTLSASIALWTHLLSAIALPLLTILWLLFFIRRRHLKRAFLVGLAMSHAVVVVEFLPWLVKIPSQIAYIEKSRPEWMTPPTVSNLLRVFTFWYPYGRLGVPNENSVLIPLGIAAVAVPFLVSLWSLRAANRAHTAHNSFLTRAGALGVTSAGFFVVTLWILHRLGVSYTFHGPRYPSLTIHLWAGGLALLVIGTSQGLRWRWLRTAIPIFPWLVCSAIGQIIIARGERLSGIEESREHISYLFPSTGEGIYIMPSELIPYYRTTLEDFSMKSVADLFCSAKNMTGATLLNLNFWSNVDRPRDLIARYSLENLGIAERVVSRKLPEGRDDYSVYRLEKLNHSKLREICHTGLSSKLARDLTHTNSKALAEEQIDGSAWSFLEVKQGFQISRWATRAVTPVAFDRDLAAGEYVLHFVGYRSEFPENPLQMRFVLKGAPEELDRSTEVSSGEFHLKFSVKIDAQVRSPVLLVEHAVWSPSEVGVSRDTRRLSFSFIGAWFEAAPQHP